MSCFSAIASASPVICLKLVESNDKDKIMKYKDEFIAYANKYNNGKLTGAYSLDGTAAINQYSHFEEWFQNNKINENEFVDADSVVPVYLRKSQAERMKDAKKNS